MAQLASEVLQKLKLTSKLGRVWQQKKEDPPPRSTRRKCSTNLKCLTHKLRIGYIYYANVCLWNICTGYKSHYSMHFYNVSISNYFQFQSPNLKGAIIKKKTGKFGGKFGEKVNHPFPFSFFLTLIFVELSIFRTSPVHILCNRGGGGGGAK